MTSHSIGVQRIVSPVHVDKPIKLEDVNLLSKNWARSLKTYLGTYPY